MASCYPLILLYKALMKILNQIKFNGFEVCLESAMVVDYKVKVEFFFIIFGFIPKLHSQKPLLFGHFLKTDSFSTFFYR